MSMAVEIGTYNPKRDMIHYSRTRRFNYYDEGLKYFELLCKKGLPVLFEITDNPFFWIESIRYKHEIRKLGD